MTSLTGEAVINTCDAIGMWVQMSILARESSGHLLEKGGLNQTLNERYLLQRNDRRKCHSAKRWAHQEISLKAAGNRKARRSTMKSRWEETLTFSPATVLLGIYPKNLKTRTHKILYTDVCSNSIHNSQKLEATKISFNK